MKNLSFTKCLLCLALIFNSSSTIAQVFTGSNAASRINGAAIVKLNPERNSVEFVKSEPANAVNEQDHLTWLANDVLQLKANHTLRFDKIETDLSGYKHYRYKQVYNGTRVEWGLDRFNANYDGYLTALKLCA